MGSSIPAHHSHSGRFPYAARSTSVFPVSTEYLYEVLRSVRPFLGGLDFEGRFCLGDANILRRAERL
ncbi:hypothetical protein VTG60DRAFT_526 [Thermothelomyces hinnuleus]